MATLPGGSSWLGLVNVTDPACLSSSSGVLYCLPSNQTYSLTSYGERALKAASWSPCLVVAVAGPTQPKERDVAARDRSCGFLSPLVDLPSGHPTHLPVLALHELGSVGQHCIAMLP